MEPIKGFRSQLNPLFIVPIEILAILSELSEALLVFMTGVLALATFILAYHAWRLWKVTKEVAESAEALKTMPKVLLDVVQELKNTGGTFSRFSVKNIGYGYATNFEANEVLKDGTRSKLSPVHERKYIEVGGIFWWDIPNATVGEERNIEIKYSDIRTKQFQTYSETIYVI